MVNGGLTRVSMDSTAVQMYAMGKQCDFGGSEMMPLLRERDGLITSNPQEDQVTKVEQHTPKRRPLESE
jgi:hypothetical protein